MNRATENTLASRAVALGRNADPGALAELISLSGVPYPRVRRLAASAIGKLAGLADAAAAVSALRPLLRDTHPQTRQYAIKALRAYGTAAECALQEIRDIADNPAEKEYNRADAAAAINAIEETLRIAAVAVIHTCQRCNEVLEPDEYARSQRFFQRNYCNHCFDLTATARRNFETKVEDQKTIRVCDGTLVQSDGEKRIAEWLAAHGITYRYDARLRIIEGFQIRPDFYLPEYDIFIEYWGMDTPRYKAGMYLKQDLYLHTGKKLISIYPEDKPRLDTILSARLLRSGTSAGAAGAQRGQPLPANSHPHTGAAGAQRGQPLRLIPPSAVQGTHNSVDVAKRSQPPFTEKHK
jgi:NADH:ubiquinone oxidoreductase subunit E